VPEPGQTAALGPRTGFHFLLQLAHNPDVGRQQCDALLSPGLLDELRFTNHAPQSQSSISKLSIAPSFSAASFVTNVAPCSRAVHAIIRSKIALPSSAALDISAHDGVSPYDRKAQVEHRQLLGQALNASPILVTACGLLRAEEQLGQHKQGNANVTRLDISQTGKHALVTVEQSSHDVGVEDVLHGRSGPSIRALANVGEEGVELFSSLPFPATDLTKDIPQRTSLALRPPQPRVPPLSTPSSTLTAHRVRRVALEGLDRLVEG